MKTKYIFLVLFICVAIPSAYAIWMGDIFIDGTLYANAGSNPVPENHDMDAVIIDDSNYTEELQYNLKDGESDLIFFLDDSGIQSTDPSCVYDSGYDVVFFVTASSVTEEATHDGSSPVTFYNGWNDFNITVDPHPNRCPLNGTFTILSEMAD